MARRSRPPVAGYSTATRPTELPAISNRYADNAPLRESRCPIPARTAATWCHVTLGARYGFSEDR